MISRDNVAVAAFLCILFVLPDNAFAQAFDGIWTGLATPDASAEQSCEGADMIFLVEGAEVRGGLFAFDEEDQDFDEFAIAGDIDGNGVVANGTATDFETMTVVATFTGTFTDTSMDATWEESGNQDCFGSAAMTQAASYLEGYDELWIGTAAETQNLPECSGADPLADAIFAINGNEVVGSIEISQPQEAQVTYLATGTLDSGRNLNSGIVQIGGVTLATLSGSFGEAITTLDWEDGECSGSLALSRQADSNTPPTAYSLDIEVGAGEALDGVLLAEDPDSADVLSFSIVGQPTQGVVTITDASTGAFSYTAQRSASGTDTFEFIVSDGIDDSNLATVTVTIQPVNNALPGILQFILGDEEEP